MTAGNTGGGRGDVGMATNLATTGGIEYRNRPSGQSRAMVRHEAKQLVARQTHALVLHATRDGVHGRMFAEWFYDLRRHKLRLYGGLLRFLDLSHARGVPMEMLMNIPGWIAEYIRDLYADTPPPPTAKATVKKAA